MAMTSTSDEFGPSVANSHSDPAMASAPGMT
jgi:hypothetical protein